MRLKGWKLDELVYDKEIKNFYSIIKHDDIITLKDCDYVTLDDVYIKIGEAIVYDDI